MKSFILYLFFTFYIFSFSQEQVSILYFNDVHNIYPTVNKTSEKGGVARAKTIINQVKKENANTLTIFGGDLAGGVLFGAVFHGFPIVEAFNEFPLDIANFGQHDFDFGVDETKNLVAKSKFQWITTNLKDENNNVFSNAKSSIIKKYGNFNIAFMGITDNMSSTVKSNKVIQNDILKSIKFELESLENKNIDYFILITQTDMDINKKILATYPQIDAILTEEISGKSPTQIHYVDNRPIISGEANLGSIARLNLIKNENKVSSNIQVYSIDENVKSEEQLFKKENYYKEKLNKNLDIVIAQLKIDLDSGFGGEHQCRFEEVNVGNLITDSYKTYFQSDIAFMNGGGIRANIPKGNFTMKDALSLLPFSNSISIFSYDGKTILEALEHGVSSIETKAGRFLQVSGLTYTYSQNNPVGKRIKEVKINGKNIEPNKIYSVALPIYLQQGGDGFSMLKNSLNTANSFERKDIEIFSEYIKKLKIISYSKENRIKIIK